ncbi:hypothetical protein [Streptomyces sp. NPDC089795]|uniref:hypothetical protein n=1 Tax=Streptomyces sp. NPDC089795 TaxID=3155297 RepID=UPI00342E896B
MTEGRAVVIGPPSEAKRSRWGRWIADHTAGELTALARTLDPAVRSFIESRRLTARLVELDEVSHKAMAVAKLITEKGGWIQSTIRDDRGRVARLMRIRPATGLSALSGGAAVLGAIAAQAQAAEMARDIQAVRERLNTVYGHLRSDQKGAVDNAVEQVDDLLILLRAHGTRGVERSDFAVVRNSLGHARHNCLLHLQDAVTRLEDAGQRSPRKAEKILGVQNVDETKLYLELMTQCYAATVGLGLAEIAFEHHANRPAVARTRADLIATSTTGLRAEIENVHGQLSRLDESMRARFRPAPRNMTLPPPVSAAISAAATAAVQGLAGKSVSLGRLRGASISLPASLLAVGTGALLVVGVNASDQSHVEKKLDARLGRLAQARERSSGALDQATPSLEVLRTLAEGLAGPDGRTAEPASPAGDLLAARQADRQ